MTANNNKQIIANETVWIRQLLFVHAALLYILVVFDISSSHSNTIYQLDVFSENNF